jgi:PAS domain S-box-containing protein
VFLPNPKSKAMGNEFGHKWLQKAIDALGNRFIVISPDFKILAASPATTKAFETPIVGQHCHQVMCERASPCDNCAAREALAAQTPVVRPKPDAELKLDRIPFQYAYPVFCKGRLEAVAAVEFDLPIKTGLEDVLLRANTFLSKLLTSAVDAVIAADKQGRILIFNEMAAKTLGYDTQNALQNINIVDLYPNGKAHEVMQKLRSDAHGGKGHLKAFPVDLVTQTGDTIPVHLNASVVYEGAREIATIGLFRDMRQELRIKSKLKKTQLQLAQAEKLASLGMLAAGVAHEINNPVAIMIEAAGWIEDLLADGQFQTPENLKEINRALKQINTQGNRCKEITQELLSFSQKTDTEALTADINQIIEDVMALSQKRAQSCQVALKTALQTDSPSAQFSALAMQQVLSNLVNNALDAMADTGGTITVSSRVEAGDILVEVADSGPGISEADLSRIFDPFFTTKPAGKGTGLGLFICYGIIKTLGGKIDVNSVFGRGTTFSIRIPFPGDAPHAGPPAEATAG